MKVTFFFLLVVALFSCTLDSKRDQRQIGEYVAEGIFIKDSILDGEVLYFARDRTLGYRAHYVNGIKSGIATSYYKNGLISDSALYVNGLKAGLYYVFDSSHQLQTTQYFSNGYAVGPATIYKNGAPFQYNFYSFDRRVIFNCQYDSIGVQGCGGDVINLETYSEEQNGIRKLGFFLYLIEPPATTVKYQLGVEEKVSKQRTILKDISSKNYFIDTLINVLPNDQMYFIQAHYNYNNGLFERVHLTYFN